MDLAIWMIRYWEPTVYSHQSVLQVYNDSADNHRIKTATDKFYRTVFAQSVVPWRFFRSADALEPSFNEGHKSMTHIILSHTRREKVPFTGHPNEHFD